MVKISQITFGKVDYTRTNQTTRVPKTAVQTFKTENKTDYTTIVKEHRYTAELDALKAKFEGIDPQEYVADAKNNGFKMLVVTDADYAQYGAKWDDLS